MIIKKRNIAKMMCDKNYVRLNGRYVKPSKPVNIGDIIEIETANATRKFIVHNIPTGNIKKTDKDFYYHEITKT